MNHIESQNRKPRDLERGATMVFVLVGLVGLLAVSSLALDVGVLWAARTQLQNAADAAALAGALNLIDPAGPTVTDAAAIDAAVEICAKNGAVGASSVALPVGDVQIGNWDLETSTFDTAVSFSDPSSVTAVDVTARLDNVANGPVPAFLSRVLGRTSFDVGASATAYLGFAGMLGPGEVELPITIDCCQLKGPECKDDYCDTIETDPPKPCDLESPQDDGVTTVSCLEFHATGEQNACWTQFGEEDPSTNTNDLTDIVENGNSEDVSNTMSIFLDNGDKAAVMMELGNAFYGNGKYGNDRRGEDRYYPKDGVSDSWVQGMPVVECQDGDHCAGGENARIVGFVCIEIREIEDPPENLLRVRFLCPDDPLFDECDFGRSTTGGLDFGIRAEVPVLVR